MENIIEICKKYDAKTHIAHVARKDELEIIGRYKNKMQLTCETCPHYLLLTKSNHNRALGVSPSIGDEADRHGIASKNA